MQRMKNLLLVLGGTLDALFLKECYEKMQPHFVVAADGALEKGSRYSMQLWNGRF